MSSPLELEVYKAWKTTVYEMLGENKARLLEKKVIEKLAQTFCDIKSEKLTLFEI